MESSKKPSRTSKRSSEVSLQCRATPDQLHMVHEVLAQFWERLATQPGNEWRMLFELAVAEIAANIVEHAEPPVMHLRLHAEGGRVTAEFTDSGQGWVGPPEPSRVIDRLAERGRGLQLAIATVDDVIYERAGSVNRWLLVKRL